MLTVYDRFVLRDSVYILNAIAFIQCIVDEVNSLHATTHYLFETRQLIFL